MQHNWALLYAVKRKALAGYFKRFARAQGRNKLLNALQRTVKCRTRVGGRDKEACAAACGVPVESVVPLYDSWRRYVKKHKAKLQENYMVDLRNLKKKLRKRVKAETAGRPAAAPLPCRYCHWRTTQYSSAEYLAHLSVCAGVKARSRAISLRPARDKCPQRGCGVVGTARELVAHTKSAHSRRTPKPKRDAQCKTCLRWFTARGLTQHTGTCKVTAFRCSKCLTAKTPTSPYFDTQRGLALHVAAKHRSNTLRGAG